MLSAGTRIGIILGGTRSTRTLTFWSGGTVPPTFYSYHKKNHDAEPFFLVLICTKSLVGWGFAPDPTGGAYSDPPKSLAGFKGPTSNGREGKGR